MSDDNEAEYTPIGPASITPEAITDPDGRAECQVCCSVWFTLERRENDPPELPHGAVSVGHNGRIKSYYGRPTCVACKTPWGER